ncbi:MAG: FMN-binding protein [Longimicrobiales bacterium]|nr:FMN-binding protein [Longimicrobiales bacterium]
MTEERLPTVSSEGPGPTPERGGGVHREGDGGPSPPRQVESSSVRLVATLAVAGALAGLAIVLVYQWANPRIEAWRAEVLAAAVTEVLAGADRYETVFLEENGFTSVPTADTSALDRVYVGYDADGTPVGVAMVGAAAGFQDVIRVIFGYDPAAAEVIGMQVLESKETPGLGDKIEKDSAFVREFHGVETPLVGLKAGRETGEEDEVVMITGATISSQTVVDIINARVSEVGREVEAYWGSTALRSAVRTPPPKGGDGGPAGVADASPRPPGGIP